MLKNLMFIAIALSLMTLVGCSTVEGAGQDLQDASQATRDAIAD